VRFVCKNWLSWCVWKTPVVEWPTLFVMVCFWEWDITVTEPVMSLIRRNLFVWMLVISEQLLLLWCIKRLNSQIFTKLAEKLDSDTCRGLFIEPFFRQWLWVCVSEIAVMKRSRLISLFLCHFLICSIIKSVGFKTIFLHSSQTSILAGSWSSLLISEPDAESAEDRFRKGSEDNTHLTPQLTLSNQQWWPQI